MNIRLKRGRVMLVILSVLMVGCFFLTACGSSEEAATQAGGSAGGVNLGEAAGDYYIDLTELGMALTVFLRLNEDGTFMFSDTTDFEVNKSSGTVQTGGGEYIMVYETVNGEQKSISEGIASSFTVAEDGSLDFTGSEKIYYGSASATTTSADNPEAKMFAFPITEGYEAPDTTSEFSIGTYSAQGESGMYTATFYEDDSYIISLKTGEADAATYSFESGTYGVSVAQLALTPTGGERAAGEILSDTELKITISGTGEELGFAKMESVEPIAELSGMDEDSTFDVKLTFYSDNSYTSQADGFSESGIIVLNSEDGTFKTYPDHPDTNVRGLNQIATVPSGTFANLEGKLVLTDFRVRNSENLTRYKAELTEQ